MSKLHKLAIFLLFSFELSAFAAPYTLEEKVKKADTILRVVVLSAVEVESEGFTSLARCRIISKYKGGTELGDFVHIPIEWTVDPSPGMEPEGDYLVFLESLKTVAIAHPVTWDSALEISDNKVAHFEEKDSEAMKLSTFEEKLRKLIAKWSR